MKDIDVIDRKYTTLSSVQTVLVVLALLPIIAIPFHMTPAISEWYHGLYREALLTAILIPGIYTLLLGLAFPIVSALRGEMSRRAMLITLTIFGILAIAIVASIYSSAVNLLEHPPSRPGHTRWINTIAIFSFEGTFAGYAAGFAIGCLFSLFALKPREREAAEYP